MYRKVFASKVFERKVVLISGGCAGIGRALAVRMAQAGARLVILDLDPLALDSMVQQLADQHNAEALGLPCDVADAAAVESAVALAMERFGGIDLLVCNAGVTQRSAFADTDLAVFQRIMAVNFFGALHCARAALPSLLARRGQIVVAGALTAFAASRPGHGAVAASRQALLGLFEALRLEVAADGVNVMLVCTGSHAGDLGADRPPTAQDIAEAIFQGALRRRHLLVLSGGDWRTRLLARLAR